MNPLRLRYAFPLALAALALSPTAPAAQTPTADDLRRVLEAELLKLAPAGTTRTVLFEDVRAGSPNGGYYPFQVTATLHDYHPGYPKNKYYGTTCMGKMDKWKFDMRKDEFGGWIAQGRMTVSDATCQNNLAEGAAAIPLAGIPGSRAPASATNASANTSAKGAAGKGAPSASGSGGALYVGQYACYGTGSRLMAGMGFVLKAGGAYQDTDGGRKGSYLHDASTSTISFKGGFLDGQAGKNVRTTGFTLSSTVNCEPWR